MAPEWELLRETRGEHAIESAERLLSSIKATIEAKPPVYYNVNSHLVDGAAWVLGVADAVEGWGSGLSQVLDEYCAMNRETVRLGSLLLLESLDLTNRRMDLTAAYGIAALVYLSPTLTEVIVSSNNFGDAGLPRSPPRPAPTPTLVSRASSSTTRTPANGRVAPSCRWSRLTAASRSSPCAKTASLMERRAKPSHVRARAAGSTSTSEIASKPTRCKLCEQVVATVDIC